MQLLVRLLARDLTDALRKQREAAHASERRGGEQLSEQAVILDSLDDDVNKTDSAMHTMNRKLKTLVADAKKSDRAQWALIGCLILTLVVLTTMVLSDD